ncbi:V-type ATP synthase subunit E [Halovenus salina]|uniref:A-type ATP synthase subunit E n=1 Tax=Halovenus salina TaxID=1510225 RepID=A0ABD5VVY2_9EURY|nr:V-type ATP synthase subunit E [Halovenus salina]
MTLDTVVEDIREQARARAEEIRDEADTEANEILEAAEADAEEIRAEILDDAESQIEQEREQRMSSAKLEAKQSRLEARRDVLQSVRDDVEAEVVDLADDERRELTEALLDAAAAEIDDGATVKVYGRAEDQELLESLLAEYDGFEFAGEFDCLGGVVVESTESRVRIKNTFDSILEEVWEDNLREISDMLFEQ